MCSRVVLTPHAAPCCKNMPGMVTGAVCNLRTHSLSLPPSLSLISARAHTHMHTHARTLTHSLFLSVAQNIVMYVLAHGSRAFMTVANRTQVQGAEHMAAALQREQGRPLITVCNHVASMDDPLVMSTILPPAVYRDPSQLRWVGREMHSAS